jgi:hypothetical protein|tara:strand:+ start:485 stop:1087 length:603 start_codon:yes stop_codon:yes gene_type:complete
MLELGRDLRTAPPPLLDELLLALLLVHLELLDLFLDALLVLLILGHLLLLQTSSLLSGLLPISLRRPWRRRWRHSTAAAFPGGVTLPLLMSPWIEARVPVAMGVVTLALPSPLPLPLPLPTLVVVLISTVPLPVSSAVPVVVTPAPVVPPLAPVPLPPVVTPRTRVVPLLVAMPGAHPKTARGGPIVLNETSLAGLLRGY